MPQISKFFKFLAKYPLKELAKGNLGVKKVLWIGAEVEVFDLEMAVEDCCTIGN